MSNKRPDLSKLKQRIKSKGEEGEEEPKEAPKPDLSGPTMKPDTMRQIASYARDVEKTRAEEEEEDAAVLNKVPLDEVPEAVGQDQRDDPMYYRQTPSDNPKLRKAIEDNCSEMDFADLIITGRVTQNVPILPEKLECEFQSLLASENYWIEREAEKQGTSDWALRSWMGYARLAMSLVGINGKAFSPHAPKKGEIDSAAFQKKFDSIMGMGEKPIEYLLVNLGWFNDRVDRLSEGDFEQLKNG